MTEDREMLEQMGERGRNYVREHYNWERTAEEYRNLIEIVGTRRPE